MQAETTPGATLPVMTTKLPTMKHTPEMEAMRLAMDAGVKAMLEVHVDAAPIDSISRPDRDDDLLGEIQARILGEDGA